MAKLESFFTKKVEDLTLNKEEDSGDNGMHNIEDNNILFPSFATDSRSPPKSVGQKVSRNTSSKPKSEEIMNVVEVKRRETSFDFVIELLSSSGVGLSSGSSKAQMVSDALEVM
ncbi:hypothetical protein M5689_006557 [Euphorbia peplus]|nr:hypothetical protein M5689_006557 [Euphorbia peplus]